MNEAGGLILLYHRVTTLESDPQLLAVTPENFAAQMETLKKSARVMSLGEMVAAARRGEDLRHSVAVTFDDGYADNLLEAEPILRSTGIPATVFVASGGTESDREFFWDELDRIFLSANELPEELHIAGEGWDYRSHLGDVARYSEQARERFGKWDVTAAENPTARQRIYREFCSLIHRLTASQRETVIESLATWSRLGRRGRQSHRMMNMSELREITAGGLIDIGGHTVRHPLLSAETLATQQKEIATGKAALEGTIGKKIAGFSYPFGTRRDYTPQTIDAVRAAGFEYACSNFKGVVSGETDLFQLPRVIVRDWGAAEFLKQLA